METRWILSAVAALAVAAPGVSAEEAEPGKSPAPAPAGPMVAQAPAPAAQPPQEAKKEEPAPAPKITYGGSADFYFTHNFNDPFNNKNQFRAFDIKDDGGPHLGVIDLWVQKQRDPVGFRFDLDFGPTARIFYAGEPADADRTLNSIFGQYYLTFNLNKKGTTYAEVGKWTTMAGAEVMEPKDNWLYSRAFLYNWAQPFFHTGGRVYHYLNDTDFVGAAVTRGWNVSVGDPNHGPGFMLFGGKTLSPKTSFTATYTGGPEFIGADKEYRNFFDFVVNHTVNDKLALNINGDYGKQAAFDWYGLSVMGKYSIDSKQFVSARGEWVHDADGALFAPVTDLYSLTIGHTYQFNKYFQTKLEYRHDFNGGAPSFFGSAPGRFKDNQGTFIFSTIFSY